MGIRSCPHFAPSLLLLTCSSLPLLPFSHVVLAPAEWRKDGERRVILAGHRDNLALSSLVEGIV